MGARGGKGRGKLPRRLVVTGRLARPDRHTMCPCVMRRVAPGDVVRGCVSLDVSSGVALGPPHVLACVARCELSARSVSHMYGVPDYSLIVELRWATCVAVHCSDGTATELSKK